MLTRWLIYEQTLLARLNHFPLSTTPRERMLMLSAIRLVALGIVLSIVGLLTVSAGMLTNWITGAIAGAVLCVMGVTLLALAMAVCTILIIVYGD